MSQKNANVMSDEYAELLSSRAFVLDCWRVYPTRNLIQLHGDDPENRQLEPRLMRLLCLLAASADTVVTREEITDALWPRVVVNENSLTRAVSDLRRALTPAGGKRSELIQTIPKRGYRLTQAPTDIHISGHPARGQDVAAPPVTAADVPRATAARWISRWTPSFAAGLMLALALVLRINDGSQSTPLMAQLPAQPAAIGTASPDARPLGEQRLYDRVIGNSDTRYPITTLGSASENSLLAWQNTAAMGSGINRRQSMLTPDGQLLAYVDYRDGISSLNLRPALTEAEPWVAFTTDEHIFHLQWSPLDAGILLTVGQNSDNPERSSYLRLMLLDLESLTLQELYRRDLPADGWLYDIGNLT